VSQGQQVKKGELLFELDTTQLEEQILKQQQEMEKQKLQVEDARSQKDVSARQKASSQAGAAEQYSLSVNEANVQLSRAQQQLEDAKKELEVFRKSNGTTPETGGVEETLENTCQEKSDAYVLAQQELNQVEWKIENAVNTALENAKNAVSVNQLAGKKTPETDGSLENENISSGKTFAGENDGTSADDTLIDLEPEDGTASLQTMENTYTQSAGEILEEVDTAGEADAWIAAEGEPGTEKNEILYSADTLELIEDDNNVTANTESQLPPTENAAEPIISLETNASSALTDETDLDLILSDDNADQTDNSNNNIAAPETGTEDGTKQPPTQAELDQIEKSVRDSYRQELSAAQKKVETAQKEKEEAESALAEYQQEKLSSADARNAQSEKQLLANVKTAQQAYEDAAIAVNKAAVTAGRSVQEAGIPDASNSSDRSNEITYEQMELALKKLEKLKEDKGKVYAEADGVIMKINISTGEKTTDTTAILMADTSKGYSFTADITREQEEYIGTGDLVTLTGGTKDQKLEELPVEAVTADEEDDSFYHVTVQIPEDTFSIGMTATMDISKKSETYPISVPLSALHLDSKNQAYVLIPQEYDSIMGTEIKALKIGVTVLEKNESYAALAEGALSGQQEVIVSSDKAVDDGSRVRIAE
ncbi:MAG: hypothetical protein PHE06_15695, partial [Lachnospiraceae bacterium]|nr:hypothetical protein [Lachnospiraceae bacterium]